MKTVVYKNYGGPEVLEVNHAKKPIPKDNEILIKIYATSVTAGDARMRSFNVPKLQWIFARIYLGIFKPKKQILGMELAGIIESVGENVTRFKSGDKVFASTLGANFGAYAEYKCLPENAIISKMPENLSYTDAATLPIGASTALRLLRKAKINKGQKVLIYGASGSVGTYAVQLARFFGAEVVAVCSNSNLSLVKSLGAESAIDYTKSDFRNNGQVYDIIFDAIGKINRTKLKSSLKKDGKFVSVAGNTGKENAEDLIYLKRILEAGLLIPVVEKIYNFNQIIEAHKYVDKGHKKGNVAIQIVNK